MYRFLLLVFCACTAGPVDRVYQVTARSLGYGSCNDAGDPVDFAVPYRALIVDDEAHPGQQGWAWCNTPQCDQASADWFDRVDDRWSRIDAQIQAGPDNTVSCNLSYDTLDVRDTGSSVHADVLWRWGSGDLDNCTIAQARLLADRDDCSKVDRYELAR